MRTVGYRQVWEYLTGTVNYTEMASRTLAATRQLAKRQLTWLRSYPDVTVIEVARSDHEEKALAHVRQAVDLQDMRL